jgi:hypothetical protein
LAITIFAAITRACDVRLAWLRGITKTIWSIEDLLTATIQGAYNRVVGAAEDALIRAAASYSYWQLCCVADLITRGMKEERYVWIVEDT